MPISRQVIIFDPPVRSLSGRLDSILTSVGSGDAAAFDQLYAQFRGRVFGLCLTLIRDRHQAEEVAQETFLQIWQRAGTFDPAKGTASAWILRLAHARAVDRVRHSQTSRIRDTNHAAGAHVAENDTVLESVMLGEEHNAVRRALAMLTPKQREALTLGYFRGMTIRQISEHLSVPMPTIKTRMRDGLLKLGLFLADTTPAEVSA